VFARGNQCEKHPRNPSTDEFGPEELSREQLGPRKKLILEIAAGAA